MGIYQTAMPFLSFMAFVDNTRFAVGSNGHPKKVKGLVKASRE